MDALAGRKLAVSCAGLALLLSLAPALAKKPGARKGKAPVAAVAPPPDPTPHPNVFELKSGTLSVKYESRGADGKAHLEYADASGNQSFSGPDVRVQPSDLGDLVTVSIRRTIDSGSTSFTLVVPRVNLESPGETVTVNVLSVTTVHRFSPVPRFNQGQMETGMPAMLNGSARLVKF